MNKKAAEDTPKKRPLGMDKGKAFMSDNFDDPMPDLEEAFHGISENDPLCQPPLDKRRTGD